MNVCIRFLLGSLLWLIIFNAVAGDNNRPSYKLAEDDEYQYSYGIDNRCNEVYDPYEKLNRKIFIFNLTLDRLLLKPLALGYNAVTNNYIKARVGSVFENISTPLTTVNYALQMRFNDGMRSFWRFLINTTFGVGGLFDVASKIDLTPLPQTFSDTLAHAGAGPGPYLMLPFFGSAMGRDIFDTLLLNNGFNLMVGMPENLNYSLTGIKIVHDRAMLLSFSDFLEQNSIDYYTAVRTAIFQNRESKKQYPKWFKCRSYKKVDVNKTRSYNNDQNN